jgi:hypothetical protein
LGTMWSKYKYMKKKITYKPGMLPLKYLRLSIYKS